MDVFCDICGQRHDIRSPNVRRIWSTDVYECMDESACFERKAMTDLDREVQEVTRDGD